MTAENIFISRVAVLRVEASLALRKGCSRAALSPFPRIAMYGEELCGEGGDRELESTTLSELLSVGRKGGRTAHGILNFFRHFFPPK